MVSKTSVVLNGKQKKGFVLRSTLMFKSVRVKMYWTSLWSASSDEGGVMCMSLLIGVSSSKNGISLPLLVLQIGEMVIL